MSAGRPWPRQGVAFRAPWGRWCALDEPPALEPQTVRVRCCGGPLDSSEVALHTFDRQPSVPTVLAVPDRGGRYVLVATYQWRPTRTTSNPAPDRR